MLVAVTRDPAMLLWLDQTQSRKEHPNENFAREVMELFALGEGHYTEKDISEAARSEEHTSELQSPDHLVCRLLLEKKKQTTPIITSASSASATAARGRARR